MSPSKSKPIQIKYENAINYKADPDNDYFKSDLLQKHLKLRVLRSGTKTWVYDYLLNGQRKRHAFGELAKERKGDGLTPAQAREQVSKWEALRKQGKNPLIEYSKDVKGITLNKYFNEEFIHLREVKPSVTAKGVRQGNSEDEYKQKINIWNRHIKNQLGDLPLTQIKTKTVRDWYDNIAKKIPAHSLKIIGLAKYVMKNLLDTYEELDDLTSNKFNKIKTKEVRKSVDRNRKKRPITPDEFKAIWNACDKWHNPVEGLYFKFMMLISARGKNIGEIKLTDMKKKNGKFMFTIPHKDYPFPIILNELAEDVYLQTLKARKQYPFISPYLFPQYVYPSGKNWRGERKVIGVKAKPMDHSTRQRIWRGRSTKIVKGQLLSISNGGLRGIASEECGSVLDVNPHDIRDTHSTRAENASDAKDMLQNKLTSTIDKHYREYDFENTKRTSENQLKIVKELLS